MSDYLSRAAQRAAPPTARVRPVLPTLFEREKVMAVPSLVEEEAAAPRVARQAVPFNAAGDPVRSSPERITNSSPFAASASAMATPKWSGEKASEEKPREAPAHESLASLKVAIEAASPPTAPVLRPKLSPAPNGKISRALEQPVTPVLPRKQRGTPVAVPPARVRARENSSVNSAAAQREEPPAIHVTIGRVEVRAVHPPQASPPPRQSLPPSPRISLNEYLLSRNRGAA